ncbi:fimbrial protein [Dysgonomonas sp. ZJ279]|uniref:fimbrial protein n=1 Tax=Dysgonomonas sp. ZJ279 TaxID=2709796 RepID=UPI0013EAF2F1|nr:fimbrial protein [Dysgonomonas sp. ZJ279]
MKRLFFLTSIVALLCSACSSNDDESSPGSPETGAKASLTVTLGGTKSNETRGVGNPTQVEENTINTFTVYIFANNRLEKAEIVSTGLSLFIDGLTTGTKKIVVIANTPAGYPNPILAEGDPYSDLGNVANYINLDDQTADPTPSLIMSGEDDITLQSESVGTNTITIPVSRIVAKIKLGTITIDPAAGLDPLLFELTGVAIIKAKSLSSVGIPSVVTAQPFYSGIEGTTVHGIYIKPYLYENITIADHDERYFYVFANIDGGSNDEEATLLTLEGAYDGEIMYFPFRLPAIARNTQHTVDITLRRLGTGSPDPEIPSDPATLTVTITPEDWIIVPTQEVEW